MKLRQALSEIESEARDADDVEYLNTYDSFRGIMVAVRSDNEESVEEIIEDRDPEYWTVTQFAGEDNDVYRIAGVPERYH